MHPIIMKKVKFGAFYAYFKDLRADDDDEMMFF